uniref:Uncharacterized protein n=1 Tax=Oryza glumipatula TaxID=40148 RepID=A0A0E0BFF1_9ORYZ
MLLGKAGEAGKALAPLREAVGNPGRRGGVGGPPAGDAPVHRRQPRRCAQIYQEAAGGARATALRNGQACLLSLLLVIEGKPQAAQKPDC